MEDFLLAYEEFLETQETLSTCVFFHSHNSNHDLISGNLIKNLRILLSFELQTLGHRLAGK